MLYNEILTKMGGAARSRSTRQGATSRRLFLRVALLLAVLLLAAQWLIVATTINGTSMAPTLRNGQLAFACTQAYRWCKPKRGDLVLVSTGKEMLIKRVVGLPGENVAIHDSKVYVNGQALTEPYAKWLGSWEVSEGQLGADRYAIVGDNRSGPRGNFLLAVVGRDRILGRLVWY